MRIMGECDDAVSPVIGITLLVALTVIMVSIIAASVFAFTIPGITPHAMIVAEEAKGGLRYDHPPVHFNENWIILSHEWGDSLAASNTKIQISGYGETQNITYGTPGSNAKGNILVEYTNLEYSGKLESKPNQNTDPYSPEYHGYEFHNPILNDGLWSPGERLILNGQDSINGSDSSTVKVYMNGIAKTNNNWRFDKSKQIIITVVDVLTDRVISTSRVTVK